MTIPQFRQKILKWYKKNRRKMPWRETRDPYKILVSEIMLQQTQVPRVLPKYELFLNEFPTVKDLAKTPDKKLLQVWAGLGYWRRALYLRETARAVVKDFKSKFPRDPITLESLPGIGPYTARALACFAFNNPEPFLDTNIRRVYLHFFFPKKENITDQEILPIAQKAVWKKDPREWHYALFDYGATILKGQQINMRSRHYHRQSKFEGSLRSFRTFVVKHLLAQSNSRDAKRNIEKLLAHKLRLDQAVYSVPQVIDSLLKDKLIKQSAKNYYL